METSVENKCANDAVKFGWYQKKIITVTNESMKGFLKVPTAQEGLDCFKE